MMDKGNVSVKIEGVSFKEKNFYQINAATKTFNEATGSELEAEDLEYILKDDVVIIFGDKYVSSEAVEALIERDIESVFDEFSEEDMQLILGLESVEDYIEDEVIEDLLHSIRLRERVLREIEVAKIVKEIMESL